MLQGRMFLRHRSRRIVRLGCLYSARTGILHPLQSSLVLSKCTELPVALRRISMPVLKPTLAVWRRPAFLRQDGRKPSPDASTGTGFAATRAPAVRCEPPRQHSGSSPEALQEDLALLPELQSAFQPRRARRVPTSAKRGIEKKNAITRRSDLLGEDLN